MGLGSSGEEKGCQPASYLKPPNLSTPASPYSPSFSSPPTEASYYCETRPDPHRLLKVVAASTSSSSSIVFPVLFF
ncbi:hypothetical protein TorRG33x02_207000 [Trema orientale]|uniref:Uncharacterized protein n=1 Tax=Trema orientale TaxID=63057 RepID=A0A2P5EDD6_TREOI|nr:hypothetical protein TorRG33x02_207000 [Trema orientale]